MPDNASGISLPRLLALFVIAPLAVSAAWIKRSGEVLPDSESRKSVGDFGAQLILVADERELIKRWNTPSETVDTTTTDKVEVRGAIHAFVVFGGCARDRDGNCSVAMRFKVMKPDGTVYAETPPMEVWHLKPAPRNGILELSVDYLKVIIEPKDPLGRYAVQAQVRDNNSKVIIPLQTSFVAVERGK